jgi:hypothetical protein
MSDPPRQDTSMKPLLRFLRSLFNRFGLLEVPEPKQLDFFACLEPLEAGVKSARFKSGRH